MTAQNDQLGLAASGSVGSLGSRFDTGVREALPMPTDGPGWPAGGSEIASRLGPDSLIWKFYGDNRTQFFGFQRTAGVENCIEQLAQGVLDHSVVFSDTLGRAKRTGPPLMKTVYSDEPHEWGRKVRDFHKTIKGTISDGSRYHALNPELFYWAHASFVDQVIYNAAMFIRRYHQVELTPAAAGPVDDFGREHAADAEFLTEAAQNDVDAGGIGIGQLGEIADAHHHFDVGIAPARFEIAAQRSHAISYAKLNRK